jgi:phosphoglucosamine mutase
MRAPVRFGTDGIRGRAGEEVTDELAYRLGRAVAGVYAVPVFVGYDTRESSPALAAAVLAGLADGGARAVNLGLFTTPGVAAIAGARGGVGVVVSASHNPYFDNGLKVLGVGGTKLDLATESALEAALEGAPGSPRGPVATPPIDARAEDEYVAGLRALVPVDLAGLSVVVDCANGAASHVAPALYAACGARVTAIHDTPDGRNINDRAGSTDVAALTATVLERGADLGLALDGDADRLIAVDHEGTVRDGDDLMVCFALDRHARGTLGGGVVVTTMSNLGLHRALSSAHIAVAETEVGDRNVLLALDEMGYTLGGEQSGHVIFRDLAPTGDGLLTGLLVCELVARRGPLAALARSAWTRVPQALVNLPRESVEVADVEALFARYVELHRLPEGEARLVVRPSGTEPVVRVMVEATDGALVEQYVAALARLPRGGREARG